MKKNKLFILLAVFCIPIIILSGCGSSGQSEGDPADKVDDAAVAEPSSYGPLLDALCFSEVLHYDNFTGQPDEITTTYTLFNLVSSNDFRDKDKLEITDGAYYFSYGPESEDGDNGDGVYISPDQLYADYFASGKYQYAPEELSFLIGGTQTGIAVYLSDPPYGVEVTENSVEESDGNIIVNANISRTTFDEEPPLVLGDAVITLKKDESGFFGYKIVSFQPQYDEFETILLQ